jgi:FKBP-type peptidyl-prolyl cis-trans isomerase
MKKIILQIFIVLFCLSAHAQKVFNIHAEQRGQDIVILYSLETTSPCEVSLLLSQDNGVTWSAPLKNVSGDVGKNIAAGEKQITWRVLEEREQLVGDKIKFKVAADIIHSNNFKYVDHGKETMFLRQNANKEGVVTTASGLQYKVVKEGVGISPDKNDIVVVHYKGSLVDGTTFDSSFERGEPIEISSEQVILGWAEGLSLMKAYGRYELYIPENLAYGENGAGGIIPPYATLIFVMEITGIKRVRD